MVDLLPLGEGGGRVSLLQQGAACITLILQDVIHSLIFPYPSRCILGVQDFRDLPRIPAGDQLGVVAVLRREGVELVIGVRTDTGIGRYPQLRIPCSMQ